MRQRIFSLIWISLVLTTLLITGCFQLMSSKGASETETTGPGSTQTSTMASSPSVRTADRTFVLPSPASTSIPIDHATLELREYALNLTSQDLKHTDLLASVFEVLYSSRWQPSSMSPSDETAVRQAKQVLNDWGYHCENNRLYKDNQLLVQSLFCNEADASFNHSVTDFVWFLPVRRKDEGSLVRRDSIDQHWRQPDHFWVLPRYVGDKLLIVQRYPTGDWYEVRVEIGGQTVYSQTLQDQDVGDCLGMGIQVWDDLHWGLNTEGDVIIDGEMAGREQGYAEAFGLQILDGKPVYFATREQRVEMIFAGQTVPLKYDQVFHRCYPVYQEVFSPLDIRVLSHMLWFFARKGEMWYYVELEVQD